MLLIEVLHSKLKDLLKPNYIMTPKGIEHSLRKVDDGIAYFGKGFITISPTSQSHTLNSEQLKSKSNSNEEIQSFYRTNSLSLNDIVIQEGKRGDNKKIFEIHFDNEIDGFRLKDSGDLKIFVKMTKPAVIFNSHLVLTPI